MEPKAALFEINDHCFSIDLQLDQTEGKVLSFISESLVTLLTLKIEKTEFPSEMMTTLEHALDCFTSSIIKVPKKFPKKLNKLAKDFHKFLQNFLLVINYSLEELQSDITEIFVDMHSMIDSLNGDILLELQSNLKRICQMPEQVTYQFFRKKILLEADSLFYEAAIKRDNMSIEELKALFKSTYSELIKNDKGIDQEFNNYEQLIHVKKQQIAKDACEKICLAVKEKIVTVDYCWIVLKKFQLPGILNKVGKKIGTCFEPFEAVLGKSVHYEIIQCIEVNPGLCIIINSPNSGKSQILYLINFKTHLKASIDSDHIKIASGSTEEDCLIAQNHPKKLSKVSFSGGKLSNLKDISINLETFEYIQEIIYIQNSNTIIFTTNASELYIIKDGINTAKLDHDPVYSIKYIKGLSLYAEIASNALKLYDDDMNPFKSFIFSNFEELIYKQVEASINYNCEIQVQCVGKLLLISNLIENTIYYFKVKLSDSEYEEMMRDKSIFDKVVNYSKKIPGRMSIVLSDLVEKKSEFEDIKYDYQFGVFLDRKSEEGKLETFNGSQDELTE